MYIDFAHNIIGNLKCGANYDGQYKIYGYGDYFSEITAPNEILMCNILDDVLKKSKNIPLNILNINCWDFLVVRYDNGFPDKHVYLYRRTYHFAHVHANGISYSLFYHLS